VVQAALRERAPIAPTEDEKPTANGDQTSASQAATQDAPAHTPATGTVVLDATPAGIVVPSFLGKTVRSAIELAEENGLDLEAVGSGVAREQSPAPGSQVVAGAKVVVKFVR